MEDHAQICDSGWRRKGTYVMLKKFKYGADSQCSLKVINTARSLGKSVKGTKHYVIKKSGGGKSCSRRSDDPVRFRYVGRSKAGENSSKNISRLGTKNERA